MPKNFSMTNALNDYWGNKKDTKTWKKSWNRTKFTMAIQKMPTPKLDYNSKLGRIILGKPKNK